LPKKLRQSCKIIDTNAPEYQENERKQKAAASANSMNKEMTDTITQGFDFLQKQQARDKWEQDLPDGADNAPKTKYDNDYSRFDNIPDVVEQTVVEDRDWYYDEKGNRQQIQKKQNAPASADRVASDTMKKGFLSGAKPLYPKGSTEGREAPDEDKLMKELMKDLPKDTPQGSPEEEKLMRELLQSHGEQIGGLLGSSENRLGAPMNVKTQEYKAAEFALNETADGLQLLVTVPGLESMKGVNLDVTEKVASLAFPNNAGLKPLQVELPTAVNPQAVRAKFSKKTQQVTISLPHAA